MKREIVVKHFDSLIRRVLYLTVFLPLLFIPFLLSDVFSLPKVTMLRFEVVLVLAIWTLKIAIEKRLSITRIAIHPSITFFLLILVTSTVLSINPTMSFFGNYKRYEGLTTWLAYFIILTATVNFVEREKVARYLKFSLFVAMPISAYAMLQFFGWDFLQFSSNTDLTRSFSTLGNPVFLGAYLVLIIPVSLGLFLMETTNKSYLYAIAFVILFFTLISTCTRAAWLGAISGIATFLVLSNWKFHKKKKVFLLIFITSLLFLSIFFLQINQRLPRVYSRIKSAFELSSGSVSKRFDLWQTAVSLTKKRPLFGWGIENFRDSAWPYRPDNPFGEAPISTRPHNQLLYLGASVGVTGLIAFLWLIYTMLARAMNGVRETENQRGQILSTAIVAAVVGYLVQEQFSFSLVEVTPLFWLFIGLAVILGDKNTKLFQYSFKKYQNFFVVIAAFAMAGLLIAIFFSARFFLADYHYRQYLDGRPALVELNTAVDLNPYENLYRNELGTYLYKLGTIGNRQHYMLSSISTFKSGLQVNSSDKIITVNLAKVYTRLAYKDSSYLEPAIYTYKQVLRIDPHYLKAYRAIAIMLLSNYKAKLALPYLKTWLTMQPKKPEPLFYMATAFDYLGEDRLAAKYYQKVVLTRSSFSPRASERLKVLE